MVNDSREGRFCDPSEVQARIGEVGPIYRSAFGAESIWGEESECASSAPSDSCPDGLSRVRVGEKCVGCGLCPTKPAYPDDALRDRFEKAADGREAAWYLEEVDGRLALAAFAWRATAAQVATEKYKGQPEMAETLSSLAGEEVVWLDEVFGDSAVLPKRKLDNFADMCRGFADRLGEPSTLIAFRTISPAMRKAASR